MAPRRAAPQAGRWTHDHDGESVVVFLIGLRINHWWRPDRWLPVYRAAQRMYAELRADRSLGLLRSRRLFGGRGITSVQYWRSLEHLYAWANAGEGEHRPAWAAFNRRARDGRGAVGVWHETYVVPPGGHESMFIDMPRTGLAAAVGARAVAPAQDRARDRMAASSGADDEAPPR